MKRVIVFALMFAGTGLAWARGAGSTGATFLKIAPGARAVAMGNAFTGVADDVYALYWNPAGLARLTRPEVTTNYLRYFQDVNYGFVAGAAPLSSLGGTVGVGVTYLGLSGIEGRAGDTEAPDRAFNVWDTAGMISYARPEVAPDSLPGLSLGGTVKVLASRIDTTSAVTAAADLGAHYQTPLEPLTLGIAFRNIGPGQRFVTTRDKLPLTFSLGAAYRLFNRELTLAADLDEGLFDSKFYANLGAEYTVLGIAAARVGYRFGNAHKTLGGATGLTAGGGVSWNRFSVDYGFVPFGDLGNTHRVSLSVKF